MKQGRRCRLLVAGVAICSVALVASEYLGHSFRSPRATLMLAGTIVCSFSLLLAAIDRRPRSAVDRQIVVGDDTGRIESVLDGTERPAAGYILSSGRRGDDTESAGGYERVDDGSAGTVVRLADGGGATRVRRDELRYLGGVADLSAVLAEPEVDRAILAFSGPDRTAFFGALSTCRRHGIPVAASQECADAVLTKGSDGDTVEVDVEPWDRRSRVLKCLFDKTFALAGLAASAPILLAVAVAIKLDSPGPVLYSQDRTAMFGETFRIYKFRSMVTDAETESGARLSDEDAGDVDPRVTRVGRVLRRTHLDELPQLLSILTGDMSVVGPRPERPAIDAEIDAAVAGWPRRWFVKPGLTGLAQVNDVSSVNPELKLRYDVEYIRHRSFALDVRIVLGQLRTVLTDVYRVF
jgi:lipopolysaccharide/colanic/teichoic acid biosynthesis glycosyltransferase